MLRYASLDTLHHTVVSTSTHFTAVIVSVHQVGGHVMQHTHVHTLAGNGVHVLDCSLHTYSGTISTERLPFIRERLQLCNVC